MISSHLPPEGTNRMFRRLLNFARSLLQRAAGALRRVHEEIVDLEPEEVEVIVNTVVRVSLNYRELFVRFVEIVLDSLVTTIKENQWEPQR